jgi:hypothetical protein
MSSTSKTILSNHVHTGDGVLITVIGNMFKGDGFYSRSDGFHTVQYTVTNFIGTASIQASLATVPTEQDWFTLAVSNHISDATDTNNSDGSHLKNFTGNYVWIRAMVLYTAGSIDSIMLNH